MSDPIIEISSEADADLRELFRYISERDGERRARIVIARITRSIQILATMPRMGRPKAYLEPGQRTFAVRPWMIVYDPLPNGVLVARIIDGRRDLAALLARKP